MVQGWISGGTTVAVFERFRTYPAEHKVTLLLAAIDKADARGSTFGSQPSSRADALDSQRVALECSRDCPEYNL